MLRFGIFFVTLMITLVGIMVTFMLVVMEILTLMVYSNVNVNAKIKETSNIKISQKLKTSNMKICSAWSKSKPLDQNEH